MKIRILQTTLLGGLLITSSVLAGGVEETNDCSSDPSGSTCERTGSCSIQGSYWYQIVTIDRRDKYDTMGWAGLCDQIHVGLVQGRCDSDFPGGQRDVTVTLRRKSAAFIPSITGTLACGGDGGGQPTESEICGDGIDNDGDNRIDCNDRKDCRRDPACML